MKELIWFFSATALATMLHLFEGQVTLFRRQVFRKILTPLNCRWPDN